MKLDEVSDQEIRDVRGGYSRALRAEIHAAVSVRRNWHIVIAALDEVLRQRNGGKRTMLDATKMTPPGSEPLA